MMLFLDYSCPGRNSRFHYGPRQAGAEFVPILLLHNTCAAPLGLKCTAPTIPAPPIAVYKALIKGTAIIGAVLIRVVTQ